MELALPVLPVVPEVKRSILVGNRHPYQSKKVLPVEEASILLAISSHL